MNYHTMNSTLIVRPATPNDEQWLWDQYSELLKPSIETQWGWNEVLQYTNFKDHLPYSLFSIVEKSELPVAAYATETKAQCIYLHMLLVSSEHQLLGVGTHLIDLIKTRAVERNLPIELTVFPANQVSGFYEKNGFKMIEANANKQLFRWLNAAA